MRSLGLGRIEQLFAGGVLEAPAGSLDLPPFPASAAGPDLRQLVLGSEGRLGFLTDVVLRTTPLPDADRFDAWAMPGWAEGLEAARDLARSRPGLSMLRLSTAGETRALLAFADKPRQLRALGAYLRARRRPSDWCLLLVGASGSTRTVKAARGEGGRRRSAGTAASGCPRSPTPGTGPGCARRTCATRSSRRATAPRRSRPRRTGRALPGLLARLELAIGSALADRGERVHVFTHLSHVYPSGSSLYVTYLFRLGPDPDEARARDAGDQARRLGHDRRRGRDDQPPPRRRRRSRAVPRAPRRARSGWPRSRRSSGRSTRTGS